MNRVRLMLPPLLALALGGCITVLPKVAPAQLYRFGVGEVAVAVAPTQGAAAIALGEVTLPRAAAGDGVLTVSGDQTAYVAGARWVSPAVILMREAAVDAFAARPGVRLTGADSPSAARLDLSVSAFEADYPAAGAAPVVRVALTATLTRRAGPVAVRTFAVDRPAGANRLSAIVPAYDAATRVVLGQAAVWVEAQVMAPVAAMNPPDRAN